MFRSHALSFGFVLAAAATACGGQGDFPDQSGDEQVKPGVETASQQAAGSVRAVTPPGTAAADENLNSEMPPAAREIGPGELKVPAPQHTGPTVTTQPFGIDGDWGLTGNAGTNPTNNYVGTTDNVALEFRVNSLRALRIEPGANPNIIGGHSGNSVSAGALGAVVAGGGSSALPNRVYDHSGVVGGGLGNAAGQTGSISDDSYATVGGGFFNAAKHTYSTVAGGWSNTGSADGSSLGGGYSNDVAGGYGVIAGGYDNTATGAYSAISGGYSNEITGDYGAVAGGYNNTAGIYSTVAGGKGNTATALQSTVAGGDGNSATGGSWGTIGGGQQNTVTGAHGTVAGGGGNAVSGVAGAIPGGLENTVSGESSFAAGCYAHADHASSFVWGGSCDDTFDTHSFAANSFTARAPGGARFYSSFYYNNVGVKLEPGAGAWTDLSDRDAKTAFEPLNPREVLDKVAAIPVSRWSYKTEGNVRHIGPMAQDFYAAFALGTDDKGITTIDAEGVALAAIQGLHSMVKDQAVRIEVLDKRNADLARENADMRTRMDKFEQALAARPLHASSSNMNSAWLGLGAIALGGVFVASRRKRNAA